LPDYIFIALLAIHVLAIVGWMGAGLLFSSVLGPSLSEATPNARAEFLSKLIPRYTRYVTSTSIAAVVFGLALYGYSIQAKLLPSGLPLILLQVGAGVGLAALIITLGYVVPVARRLQGMLKVESTQVDVVTKAQIRVRMGTASAVGLLFIVIILMVLGVTL
jgi:uncharacterized membrane protein